MKNYTLKFSKIYLLFFATITTSLIFISCATTYYASGDSYYISNIDSYGEYDLKGKKFFIEPGMEDVSENDLQFKEFKEIVTKSFIRKGALATPLQNDADIIILLQYGISDPQRYQENIPIPIWGRTGIASSTTTTNTRSNTYGNAYGNVYSSGNVASGSVYGSASTNKNTTSSTKYKYNYGISGVYTKAVTRTEFHKYCNVYAFDNKTKSNDMLWKTSIISTSPSGDLRETFPYLVYTAMDLYGINTGKMITLCTKKNNSINLLTNTEIETTSDKIYNPKQSSNAVATFITEIVFHSNKTRVYFRTIGKSGTGISISKKTVLKVNGKEYAIIETNTALSPNKLVFQKNGQVYDFHMDFPALIKDDIKTISIIEPESNGWNFTVQLD